MIKLSDYVADFVARQGIRHIFAVTGGASIHIIDSLAKHSDTGFVCPHHEQAGAMAADAYARVTGNMGAALATSGPGATNLITGICCAWFDSVPVLFLTGQVTTFRFRGSTGVRQMGFQETQITEMVGPITKYATLVTDPTRIRYELEKAVHIAKSGRPGPVLVDIPDDLQRTMIDAAALPGFAPDAAPAGDFDEKADACLRLLADAERPVLIVGWGVRLAGAVEELKRLAQRIGFPVCPSWAVRDMFDHADPLLVGSFGTHGSRFGNFAVQNSDLVLAIGARLSTRETGSPMESWARGAKTIIVDVDEKELGKFTHFGKPMTVAVNADAKTFIRALLGKTVGFKGRTLGPWLKRIGDWKARYPICPPAYEKEVPVNPYVFVRTLSGAVADDELIFADTGCTIAWLCQAFEFSGRQRLFHAFNNTPMGYALPAAIGGCFAAGNRPVTCVAGDGSLMLNIQELATVRRHNLPIKLLVFNNQGYSMVQQTQEQWFESRYYATSFEGGLGFPDFAAVGEAFGIPTLTIDRNDAIADVLAKFYATLGPVMCDVHIPREHRVVPQNKYGRPIEDAEPLLPREEFLSNMLVSPLPVSME